MKKVGEPQSTFQPAGPMPNCIVLTLALALTHNPDPVRSPKTESGKLFNHPELGPHPPPNPTCPPMPPPHSPPSIPPGVPARSRLLALALALALALLSPRRAGQIAPRVLLNNVEVNIHDFEAQPQPRPYPSP